MGPALRLSRPGAFSIVIRFQFEVSTKIPSGCIAKDTRNSRRNPHATQFARPCGCYRGRPTGVYLYKVVALVSPPTR